MARFVISNYFLKVYFKIIPALVITLPFSLFKFTKNSENFYEYAFCYFRSKTPIRGCRMRL